MSNDGTKKLEKFSNLEMLERHKTDDSQDEYSFFPSLETVDEPTPSVIESEEEWNDLQEFFLDREDASSVQSDWSIETDIGCASSLASWGEDEYDRQAATKVAEMFAEIDLALYEGKKLDDPEMEQECRDWANKFPHLRVVGSQIPTMNAIQNEPPLLSRPPSVTMAQKSKKLFAQVDSLSVIGNSVESTSKEEIFAQHGKGKISAKNKGKSPTSNLPPSASLRNQVSEKLFDYLWPQLTNVALEREPTNKGISTEAQVNYRTSKRHSDPHIGTTGKVQLEENDQKEMKEIERKVVSLDISPPRSRRRPIGIAKPIMKNSTGSRLISAPKPKLPRKNRPPALSHDMLQRRHINNNGLDQSSYWSRLPPIEVPKSITFNNKSLRVTQRSTVTSQSAKVTSRPSASKNRIYTAKKSYTSDNLLVREKTIEKQRKSSSGNRTESPKKARKSTSTAKSISEMEQMTIDNEKKINSDRIRTKSSTTQQSAQRKTISLSPVKKKVMVPFKV